MAVWAPLVPYAKSRLGADDALLGLLLLCLGVGSFATMPIAGALAARLGCRRVILAAIVCLGAILPLLASVSDVAGMAVLLLLFGAALGAADVAMNVQAVIVEQLHQRAMMSGFHAFYSLGGIAGAGGVSLALWLGASPVVAAAQAAALLIVGLLPFGRHMLPQNLSGEAGRWLTRPKGIVLVIGWLCFAAFLAEGAVLDWSGVFLTASRHVDPARAGAGFAVFSVAMTVGRLAGETMIRWQGTPRVVSGGAVCAALGVLIVVGFASAAAAIVGFGLVGLGVANLVPALYSALGRQQAMPANLAISAAATLGYAGILAGPVLIGFIARAVSLSTAFVAVSAMLCVVAIYSRMVCAPRRSA
jgi:predicted MFS family arabinose efflux permease